MITGSAEYQQYLAELANSYNPPNILIRIPASEPLYKVDLNTRVIEAPKLLGVEADHEAELIYFQMNRYYDNIDLSQCIGAVQFKNAKNEEYIYIIPAYDLLSLPGKIIFAWNIQSPVTKYGGVVQFSFKFFKIDKASGELLYELNTLVCKSKVLVGWANKDGVNHKYNQFTVDQILTDSYLTFEYDDEGQPIYEDKNGNILTYRVVIDEDTQKIRIVYYDAQENEVPSNQVQPRMKVSGQSIWSKIQEIYDANKTFNVYWEDA